MNFRHILHTSGNHGSIFALGTILLTLFYSCNLLRVVPEGNFSRFQRDSQSLVEVKLIEIQNGRPLLQEGFLRMNKPFFQRSEADLNIPLDPLLTVRYNSQFGLQGMAAGLFQVIFRTPVRYSISFLEWTTAFVTATVLMTFLATLARRYGWIAGCLGYLTVACAPGLLLFARNLYWVPGLSLLPFVIAYSIYPSAFQSSKRHMWAMILIGLAVFTKCLCGYEYITCIISAAVGVIIFEGLLSRMGIKTIVVHGIQAGIAGCGGFFAAIVTHLSFLTIQLGSAGAAFDALKSRAMAATLESHQIPDAWVQKYADGPVGFMMMLMKYMTFNAIDLGIHTSFGEGEYFFVRLTYAGILFTGFAGFIFLLIRRKPEAWAAGIGLLLALLASTSWLLLARTHSLHHFHINHFVLVIPFLLQWIITFSLIFRDPRGETKMTLHAQSP